MAALSAMVTVPGPAVQVLGGPGLPEARRRAGQVTPAALEDVRFFFLVFRLFHLFRSSINIFLMPRRQIT